MRFETITIVYRYNKWVEPRQQLSGHSLAEVLSGAVKPHQRVVSMTYHDNNGMSAHYDVVLENHEVRVLDNVHVNHTLFVNKCAKDWQEDSLLNPAEEAKPTEPRRRSK